MHLVFRCQSNKAGWNPIIHLENIKIISNSASIRNKKFLTILTWIVSPKNLVIAFISENIILT